MSKFIEDYRGNSILFLKFIEEEFLESFMNGNIYCNNFEYFQDLEAVYGEKGIGDKNDGCLPIFNLQNIVIQINQTGQIICQIPTAPEIKISSEVDLKTAVFCLYEMKAEEFDVIGENEEEIRLLLHFTEDQKKVIRKEFASKSHVVLIEPTLFLNRLLHICELLNLCVDYRSVEYYQHGINDEKRLSDYNSNKPDKWFWKEDYFRNQKEFRIVFRNKQINQGQVIVKIGDLSEFGFSMTIDDLLSQDYILAYSLRKEE